MNRDHGFIVPAYKGPYVHDKPITRQQFGYQVAETLRWPRRPTRKLGEICRLARIYRGMTPRQAAAAAGCAASHLCRLQTGDIASLDKYAPFIAAVRLDARALLDFITKQDGLPDAEQAQSLLLDENVTVNNAVAVRDSAPRADPAARVVLIHNIKSVLTRPWRPTAKVGEICKVVRKYNKQSQGNVGEKAGYSTVHVSRLEAGEGSMTGLERLAKALGLNAAKIFELVTPGAATDESSIDELLPNWRFEEDAKNPPGDKTGCVLGLEDCATAVDEGLA